MEGLRFKDVPGSALRVLGCPEPAIRLTSSSFCLPVGSAMRGLGLSVDGSAKQQHEHAPLSRLTPLQAP